MEDIVCGRQKPQVILRFAHSAEVCPGYIYAMPLRQTPGGRCILFGDGICSDRVINYFAAGRGSVLFIP